jgi:NET1-associated nuclear protein 1 (U3 small nucleolar RNA-associated protein 17)
MAAGKARVKISIFQASSSIPLSIHSLPFSLRNVELNSFQTSKGFSFVAITHAWRVVSIGGSVPRSTDEGLSPKAISFDGQRQNRTLFQDIFGVSAFEEDSHVDQPSTSAALSRKGVDHPLSDIPAFATPSFDTFFDTFLNAFLTPRELHNVDKDEEVTAGIEDDVMDQNEDTAMIQLHKFRFPNPDDLEAFTQLFRSTCGVAEGVLVAFLNSF